MTTTEFSNAFDTLLNSYNNKSKFGDTASVSNIVLDEYEKSVFLTQAQDVIIKSYFSKTTNQQEEGIDDSTRRQMDFSNLITVSDADMLDTVNTSQLLLHKNGTQFKLPSNILLILNETVIINNNRYVVVPINHEEYDRLTSKAFDVPLKKQCWRLFVGLSDKQIIAEVIPPFTKPQPDMTYRLRFIKRPSPIILADIGDLQIDNESSIKECELNPIIHIDILNKAFELAIIAKTGTLPEIKE